jgi:uncharacterized repeat protein (TIGR02543 family)
MKPSATAFWIFEQKPDVANQDATEAPQRGDTGKVKVIFHKGFNDEDKECIEEVKIDSNVPVEFPNIELREDEIFGGWFKDAKFASPVNVDKAKSPKEGDLHFYAKYTPARKEIEPNEKLPTIIMPAA